MWVNYRLWPVTHLPCFRHFGELQVAIIKKHTFVEGVSFALITHLPLWGWWQCGFSQLSSSKYRVSRRGQDEGGSDDFKSNQSKRPVLFDKSTPLVFALPPSWTNVNPEYWEFMWGTSRQDHQSSSEMWEIIETHRSHQLILSKNDQFNHKYFKHMFNVYIYICI